MLVFAEEEPLFLLWRSASVWKEITAIGENFFTIVRRYTIMKGKIKYQADTKR